MFYKIFPAILVVSIVALIGTSVASSKQWFYLQTGLHNIEKMGLSGEYDSEAKSAIYEKNAFNVPAKYTDNFQLAQVLGESSNSNKRIEVDLSNQKLYAYEGNNKVFDFTVSTGNPWTPTPVGEYKSWIKVKYQRMKGGSKALRTFYDLPNVPNIMYLYNDKIPKWKGYGIHGAYWHNNFGHPMSHGCINMKLPDAEALYNWSEVGMSVTIHGSTPPKG